MTDQSIIRVFPGWRVVREIGAGGFGKVYEIERDRFGKIEKAAIKVMNIPNDRSVISEMREDGYDDESIKSRLKSDMDTFAMEYDNMRKVVHTNIVNCDDIEYVANTDGFGYTVYLKMELLTPLMASLKNGYDREKTTVALAKDICKALELCESRNIVHRDIKPQNLFVNEYGEYKLGDFGIAREMDHATNATKTGTYKYMAPEVYNNQPYDHNVDIYSLGLVMYWLLNEKRMPFVPLPPAVPTAQEEEAAKSKRLRGERIPAPKYGSAGLKKIVLKACGADRRNRYQSAAEMLADLELLGKPATAKPSAVSYAQSDSSVQADSVSGGWDDGDSTIGTGKAQGNTPVDSEYSFSYKSNRAQNDEKTRGNSWNDDGETVATASKRSHSIRDNSSLDDMSEELFGTNVRNRNSSTNSDDTTVGAARSTVNTNVHQDMSNHDTGAFSTYHSNKLDYLQKNVKVPKFMPSYVFGWIVFIASWICFIVLLTSEKTHSVDEFVASFVIGIITGFFIIPRLILKIRTNIIREGNTGRVVFPEKVLLPNTYAVAVNGIWRACGPDHPHHDISFPLSGGSDEVVVAITYFKNGNKNEFEAKYFMKKKI